MKTSHFSERLLQNLSIQRNVATALVPQQKRGVPQQSVWELRHRTCAFRTGRPCSFSAPAASPHGLDHIENGHSPKWHLVSRFSGGLLGTYLSASGTMLGT